MKYKGILLAISSGLMFSLSNLWISPLMGVMANIFSNSFNFRELILFIVSSTLLVSVNLLGITLMFHALRQGQASKLVPIQNTPVQLTPPVIYFTVFLLIPPNVFSTVSFIFAAVMIITSSFILGKRQAQIDEIK